MKKLLLALVVLASFPMVALADQPSLVLISDGSPAFGEMVTFDASTDRTAEPWVYLECRQVQEVDGALVEVRVLRQWHGLFEGYYTEPIFALGPTDKWTSGAATCEAQLLRYDQHFKAHVLATVTFDVTG